VAETPFRSGVAALVGRPNAGKSTLLNGLVGQKLAIVTAKPQTTRSRILGIVTRPDAQVLLVDTPGFHENAKAFNRGLVEQVHEALDDCDVAVLLADPLEGLGAACEALGARLLARGTPYLVVATKVDREDARKAAAALPVDLRVSAHTGEGMKALLEALVTRLPEGLPFYPEDQATDRSLRFLAAEEIREAVFEELGQELPYETAVEVMAFDESRADLLRIEARLLVARESQKAIAIGAGGAMIRCIGTRARRGLEALLERRVHLALRVKVDAGWSKRPKRLNSLGYH
jgi:GTPase